MDSAGPSSVPHVAEQAQAQPANDESGVAAALVNDGQPLTDHSPPVPDPTAMSTTDKSPGPSIQVYGPATTSTVSSDDLPESFFEPTLNDVQAHHRSVLDRSQRLNAAPLLTSKHRDAERLEREKRKADKWPNATIRVKFSDGTVVQSSFSSDSPIQPVYTFVRTTLDPSVASKPFLLWQPPRTQYPERPPPADPSKKAKPPIRKTTIIPPASYGTIKGGPAQGLQSGTGGDETLTELGLVPQSVLLIKWTDPADEGMNASGFPAPLKEELRVNRVPLPPAQPKETAGTSSPRAGAEGPSGEQGKTEKKVPKWLQKGLLKKK